MEEVLSRGNMLAAYHRVVTNKGAPGVDGVTVDDLESLLRRRWEAIREELFSGMYVPSAVRKVEIPKPGGKGVRTLGIPTTLDRLIQQALLQVMQPLFDPTFSDHSFGFRPGRSAHQALDRAKAHIAAGHRWVVDMDLEKFFDRVNHDVLMSRLARRIEDKRILRLVRRYLQAGMMAGGIVSPRSEGTPQGGPLSPLLSNVLLDELDKELERRGHRFVRYADDCNIYVRSLRAGERVLDSTERFLKKRLRLTVNREKSAVDRPWKRKFLGYTFTMHFQPKFKVAPESVKRFKGRLREMFRRGRGRSLRRVIGDLRPVLIGWVSYYRKSEVRNVFEQLDQWIRRKLRVILWRQWKRNWTRAKELIRRGLSREQAWTSATNGRGPWWNAGASHMNRAVPTRYLSQLGLVSLIQKRLQLACSN
ncbi:MAG: group II intron reverse transcriptase/maturase [Planctomycetes bacterium]|nr:group II intron reverse transcriptase/maturase [Planctomycetota bacterium]